MPDVIKETLLVGQQRDGRGRPYTVTPHDVADALRNVDAMILHGIPVPVVMEHVDVEAGDADAWRARFAKYTAGWVMGAAVNSRGALDLRLRIPDPANVKVMANCRFVSPRIHQGYTDTQGNEYAGATIVHVAITPVPCQPDQRPFDLSAVIAPASTSASRPPRPNELADLIAALRAHGVKVPPEVKNVRQLTIAVLASGNRRTRSRDDELNLDLHHDPAARPGGPMAMSSTRGHRPAANANAAIARRAELARRLSRGCAT